MAEEFNYVNSGVENNVNVADLQNNGQVTTNTQNNTVDPNMGVNNQQVDTINNHDKVEQAFAKRLASEKEKIEKQFSPYYNFIQDEASKYNMTPDQYLQAIQQQRQEQERQELIKQGINPDYLDKAVNNHPIIQQAAQYLYQQQQIEAINTEAREFADVFPDIKAEDMPKEVYALREQRGLSLLDAYLRINHKSAINQAMSQGEQNAISKLSKNASSSPGSLNGIGENIQYGYSSLSPEERRIFREKVKRGEITDLN